MRYFNPRATYSWRRRAFKHEGNCDICECWTRSGVCATGRMRFEHLCEDCARNRFAGAIVDHDPWTPLRAGLDEKGGG